MFKYAFRYNTTSRYDFNISFTPKNLNISTANDSQLLRPFGSSDIYQVGTLLPLPEPFILTGFYTDKTSDPSDAETDVDTLTTNLLSCDRLYSTDEDDMNEAYVDCCGAAPPQVIPIFPHAIRVIPLFLALLPLLGSFLLMIVR